MSRVAIPERERHPMSRAKKDALRRFVLRDGGLSSWTLVSVLVPSLSDLCEGACGSSGLGSIPFDPSDLHRCMSALDKIPRGRSRLARVAEQYPQWAPLVANWGELESLWHEEAPSGTCTKTWNRMRELRGLPPVVARTKRGGK